MANYPYFHTVRPEMSLDLLSSVLNHFSLNADVFFSGNLCGTIAFNENENEKGVGHLHLLRSGSLTVQSHNGIRITLDKPSVLYFPCSTPHRLFVDENIGVDLVCANIKYQDSICNPLLKALPLFLKYEIEDSDLLSQSATWIFKEAFTDENGKQLIVNRLCDIFLVNILRKILQDGSIKEGMMAGLAHPQISKILVQMHNKPEDNWSLTSMAEVCAMSRSKFAENFKTIVGQTPSDYLTDWRISIAKKLILKGNNMDLIANQIGYENGSTLARTFRKKIGKSPREWLTSQ